MKKPGGKRRPTPYYFLDHAWIGKGDDAWSNRELWTWGALCICSVLQGDKSGASIPSVASLARLAGLHRTTVGKALDDLVQRGVITRDRGDSRRFHFDRELGLRGREWVRVNWPRSVRRLRMASRRIYLQVLRFKSMAGLWAKQAKIGLWAARSARQVRRHLAYLVRSGVLWRVRMGGEGYRRPTDYYRNLALEGVVDPPQKFQVPQRVIRTQEDPDEMRAFDEAMKRAREFMDSM